MTGEVIAIARAGRAPTRSFAMMMFAVATYTAISTLLTA